jgi:2-polyprenyl-3-methyl-5-hydroxy-6-metoxy-1,4-benzoquinol methylase
VSGCCQPGDLDAIFSPGRAEREARRYQKRGVVGESRRIVGLLSRRGIRGRTVLEVGGGLGVVGLELLRAGAAHATTIDLSRSYELPARRLIDAAGVADQVDRLVGDFVTEAQRVGAADIVTLQQVVCCYPDPDALVSAAAGHAREALIITMPAEWPWARVAALLINAWPRIVGSRFRFYVHPTRTVVAAAEREGLTLAQRDKGAFWQTLIFERERGIA